MNERPLDSFAMDYFAGRLEPADAVRFEALLLESQEARDALVSVVALRETLEAEIPTPRAGFSWRTGLLAAAAMLLVGLLVARPWRSSPPADPAQDSVALVDGYLDLGEDDLFLDVAAPGDEDAPEAEVLPAWIDDVMSN